MSCNMLTLKVVEGEFSVLKVKDLNDVNLAKDFTFVAKTDMELSVVCKSENAPKEYLSCEKGWGCFRIEGTLDFSLIGILAGISQTLAENKIGIFAVSTYDTDYIFTKKADLSRAVNLLKEKGFDVIK